MYKRAFFLTWVVRLAPAILWLPHASLATTPTPTINPQAETRAALSMYGSYRATGLNTANLQISSIWQRIRQPRTGGTGIRVYAADADPSQSRRRDSPDPFQRYGVFATGQGSSGNQGNSLNQTGYDFRTGGITAGLDYRFANDLVLGTAVGYLNTRSNFDAGSGNTKTESPSGSLFATYYFNDALYVDGIALAGWDNYRSNRYVFSDGSTSHGSTSGKHTALSLSSGYNWTRGGLVYGPYVKGTWIRVDVHDFSETGTTTTQISGQGLTSLTSNVGLQASYAFSTSWGVLSPNARVEWEHQYRNKSALLSGSLLADPLRQPFAVPTEDPDRNYFNLGIGVAAQFARGIAAFLAYEAVLGRSQFSNNIFTLGFKYEF